MAVKARTLFAVGDVVRCQELSPVTAQVLANRLRHRLIPERAIDQVMHDDGRELGTLGLFDLRNILLQADVYCFLQGFFQRGAQRLKFIGSEIEYGNVLLEILEHAADNPGNDFQTGIPGFIIRQVDRQRGNGIQHASNRMIRLREKFAVQHRRLQDRDLQTRNLRLKTVGNRRLIENHVEKHRHRIHQHGIKRTRGLHHRALLQAAQYISDRAGFNQGEFKSTAARERHRATLQLAQRVQQTEPAVGSRPPTAPLPPRATVWMPARPRQLFKQVKHVAIGLSRHRSGRAGRSRCVAAAALGADFEVGKDPVIDQITVDGMIDLRQFCGQDQVELVQQHNPDILFLLDAGYAIEEGIAKRTRPQGIVVFG